MSAGGVPVCGAAAFAYDERDGALDLSERFFFEVALPSLKASLPEHWERIGAGLVGNGSECMGYDDEISRDHDWGIELFLWLSPEDFERIGPQVIEWKARLWDECGDAGLPLRRPGRYGVHETVLTPGRFYSMLIGCERGPSTIAEWRRAPESNLALCVNGRVFADPLGEFTATRERIAGYYPEDLRLKKIAARCLSMAQTGQYNFLRCAQRGDVVAKETALAKFVQDAISMVFLLNRRFMPYYKWAFRAMSGLPQLAEDAAPLLEGLYTGMRIDGELDPGNVLLREVSPDDRRRAVIVERICALVVRELARQGLSSSASTFLVPHGEEVQARIQDEMLRRIPTQYE